MWSMRCEGKHADLKKVLQCAGNFKNVCHSLAMRHQMKQAAQFSSRNRRSLSLMQVNAYYLSIKMEIYLTCCWVTTVYIALCIDVTVYV